MYIRAEEYCERVFDGTHDSPKPKDEGRLLITSKNILNQELNFKDAYLISPEEFDKVNKRSQIHQWDILFSMIGTVGSIYLERNSEINYCIKNMGVFSCGDKDKAEWLYYYLQSDEVKKRINAFMSGAVQKFVPLQFLRNLPVPEYDESKRNVAIVLSSIDKRIENLRAQNRVLEQTAKTIYDYTFLQCAGHQTTYNKTLNRNIPTNWEVKKLGDCLASISTGLNPRQNFTLGNGSIKYITVKNLTLDGSIDYSGCDFIDENARAKVHKRSNIKVGDILFASISPLGRCYLIQEKPEDWDINESVFSISPADFTTSYYLYSFLRSKEFVAKAEQRATGSIFLGIRVDTLKKMEVLWPDSKTLGKFNALIEPIFKKQLVNTKQIETLTTQRNTLLPLLMTGQVEVE